MEDFTIKSRLTTKEYAKIWFTGLYKKPVVILITLFGLYLITTVLLNYLQVIVWYDETPVFETAAGIFMLSAPALITLIAIRQYKSNPNLRNDLVYTFSDNGVIVQGQTFKSEFLWSHLVKQKELGKFLILYHTKKFGSFVDKTKLTTDQLNFIKSKVGQK